MPGVILYGPPASGKDTISGELIKLGEPYRQFERLKSGQGRTHGYRMTTESALDQLRVGGEILWENRRYGAVYAVDRLSLVRSLANGIPILHLGQVEAVSAVVGATPAATWLVVSLWCPRDVAMARLVSRGSTDLDERLKVWDKTPRLAEADITINTAETTAPEAARRIDIELRKRS